MQKVSGWESALTTIAKNKTNVRVAGAAIGAATGAIAGNKLSDGDAVGTGIGTLSGAVLGGAVGGAVVRHATEATKIVEKADAAAAPIAEAATKATKTKGGKPKATAPEKVVRTPKAQATKEPFPAPVLRQPEAPKTYLQGLRDMFRFDSTKEPMKPTNSMADLWNKPKSQVTGPMAPPPKETIWNKEIGGTSSTPVAASMPSQSTQPSVADLWNKPKADVKPPKQKESIWSRELFSKNGHLKLAAPRALWYAPGAILGGLAGSQLKTQNPETGEMESNVGNTAIGALAGTAVAHTAGTKLPQMWLKNHLMGKSDHTEAVGKMFSAITHNTDKARGYNIDRMGKATISVSQVAKENKAIEGQLMRQVKTMKVPAFSTPSEVEAFAGTMHTKDYSRELEGAYKSRVQSLREIAGGHYSDAIQDKAQIQHEQLSTWNRLKNRLGAHPVGATKRDDLSTISSALDQGEVRAHNLIPSLVRSR